MNDNCENNGKNLREKMGLDSIHAFYSLSKGIDMLGQPAMEATLKTVILEWIRDFIKELCENDYLDISDEDYRDVVYRNKISADMRKCAKDALKEHGKQFIKENPSAVQLFLDETSK